jgi:hypothetical protein
MTTSRFEGVPHGGICVSCRNSGWRELGHRGCLGCNEASARPGAEDAGEVLVVDSCDQYEREPGSDDGP